MAFNWSTRGSLLVGDRKKKKSWKVETLQRWLCWTGSPRGSALLRLSGSADILTLWSCQIRALPKKAGNSWTSSSHSGFFVCAAAVLGGAFPPRPSSGTSPRPPPLLPAPRRPAGRWLGRLAEPGLPGRRGRRPGAPGAWQPLAAAVSAAGLEESVSGPADSGAPGRRCFFSSPGVLAHRPLNQAGTGQPRNPWARGWAAELAEPQGPGAEPAPSPGPIGGAWPRGREQGGEDGVLTPPVPPLSPPGTNQEPPLPLRPLPRPGRRNPQRQSHWKRPRPPAGYLQTPSPRAAANRSRLPRMRDGGQGACVLRGSLRLGAFSVRWCLGCPEWRRGKKSKEELRYGLLKLSQTREAQQGERTQMHSWEKLNLNLRLA